MQSSLINSDSNNLFPIGFKYPSDENGEYIELEGKVIDLSDNNFVIRTAEGKFNIVKTCSANIGANVIIRIYKLGGPKIIFWTK